MTNQQFEEWLKENTHGVEMGSELFQLAHAIRNKVLHEAIDALPKEKWKDESNTKQWEWHKDGYNKAIQESITSLSSLLNLLTKEEKVCGACERTKCICGETVIEPYSGFESVQ